MTTYAPTTSKFTIDEMGESLTGFEELAIRQHFDQDVTDLLEHRPTIGIRALIFTEFARKGATSKVAKQSAMELTLGQVMKFFAEDEFEPDPDDPESDQGKDVEPPS